MWNLLGAGIEPLSPNHWTTGEVPVWSYLRMSVACPGEGNGTPLQYSCLENPLDGGAWKAVVHGVAKSRTQLSEFTFTFMRWRRKWQPTPVFLPGDSQGRGSLVGCHLWGHTPTILLRLLLCPWMWDIFFFFFGGIQHFPVDGCSAATCNFGVLAGEDEGISFYSAILYLLSIVCQALL